MAVIRLSYMINPNCMVVVYDKPKLYDLGTDPEEKYDIAGQYPEVVKELDQIATRHKASFEVAESIFDLK